MDLSGKQQLAALQGILQMHGAYRGRIDGIIGPQTRRAVSQEPLVYAQAKKILPAIAGIEEAPRPRGNESVRAQVERAARELNVPLDAAFAKMAIESGGNPTAVNGSYRGLFQMGPSAWQDASDWLVRNGYNALPRFGDAVDNPYINARAAFAYRYALSDQLRSQGYTGELSDSELYLAHQQGAAGFMRIVRASRGARLESKDSLRMVTTMQSNPPQDGKGVTTDPSEFLTRWRNVFDRVQATV